MVVSTIQSKMETFDVDLDLAPIFAPGRLRAGNTWPASWLRARQHDVGNGQIGHFDGAFDHRQGVVGKQAVGLGATQFFEQFGDVAWLAGNQLADAIQPGTGRLGTRVVRVHCNCDNARVGASSLF